MNSVLKCSSASLNRLFQFKTVQRVAPVCCRNVQQRHMSSKVVDPQDMTPPIPEYQDRGPDEPIDQKKARLLYQSRKRGMLENGLLLSTFASKYLEKLTDEQLTRYDSLINKPTNDWEIYYWAIGNKPTPTEYDTDVMDMLKEHAQNKDRDLRIRQPDLYA